MGEYGRERSSLKVLTPIIEDETPRIPLDAGDLDPIRRLVANLLGREGLTATFETPHGGDAIPPRTGGGMTSPLDWEDEAA